MSRITPTDELLNQAFQLAYFILGDRTTSIYVAMAALDKLKVASATQDRRLYYTPTGRSAYPAVRTKVNLSEMHLLQRLIYIESELFERLLEGQENTLQSSDMIIRYIKHLVRITTKHNSFYVALGVCRLLYNYTTAETAELYNLVVQDPERIRDDYYYRSRKKRLMQDLKDRFGNLVKTQQGPRREERFQAQEDSQPFVRLVRDCLMRFTPWQSACVLPTALDPDRNVITPLLFAGGDPDEEHKVELNRIHTLMHPECLERLTEALGFDAPDKRLELPVFIGSSCGADPPDERFNPVALSAGELNAIRRYLDKNAVHRKNFSAGWLTFLIDGNEARDVEFDLAGKAQFDVQEGAELIEIRSVEADEEVALAIYPLVYNQSGGLASQSSTVRGDGQRFSFTVQPLEAPSGEAAGATVKIKYAQASRLRVAALSIRRLGLRFDNLITMDQWRGRRVRLALGFSFMVLCIAGLWAYLHSRNRAPDHSIVAQGREGDAAKNPPDIAAPLTPPQSPTSPAPPRHQPGQMHTPAHGSRRHSNSHPDSIEGIDVTRGKRLRPASAMLLAVKRVYVDPFGDDPFSQQMRAMLIGRLQSSNRFTVVANREEAEAVFKGAVKPVINHRATSAIALELINANGQVIWSLSSQPRGRSFSRDAAAASATILKILLNDIEKLERQH